MRWLESPAARGFALWQAAMRWQRGIDAALHPLGLTHTQYLVLASAARAIREQNDAVAQFTIAESAGPDSTTTSALMRKLACRGLVDRGIDGFDGRRWRVLLTARGRSVLAEASAVVEAAATELVSHCDLDRKRSPG